MKITQNVLLGLVEGAKKHLLAAINSAVETFSNKKLFRGAKKTYESTDADYGVDESKVEDSKPQKKVYSILEEVSKKASDYLEKTLSVEKTNTSGKTIDLTIDGVSFGKITVLEAMRLRGLIRDKMLMKSVFNIPTLDSTKRWIQEEDGTYATETNIGTARTSVLDYRAIADPNLQGKQLPTGYQTKIVEVKKTIEIGKWTERYFSTEYDKDDVEALISRQRKLETALDSVITSLNAEDACQTEVYTSNIMKYLYGIE